MTKKALLIVSFLFIWMTDAVAQDIIWENSVVIPNSLGNYVRDILVNQNGDIFVLSLIASPGEEFGHFYFTLSKFSGEGEHIWTETIKREEPIRPLRLYLSNDNSINCISSLAKVWGISYYFYINLHIVKFGPEGNVLYEFTDTTANKSILIDDFGKVFRDSDGNYNFFQYTKRKLYRQIYNSDGEFISEAMIDSVTSPGGYIYVSDLLKVENGDYLILGSGRNRDNGKTNMFATKFSGNEKIWHHLYYSDSATGGKKIIQSADTYLILGWQKRTTFIRTINSEGELIDQTLLAEEFPDNDIIVSKEGGYLLAGSRDEEGSYKYSFRLSKIDIDYNKQWDTIWGNIDGNNSIGKVIQLNDGNYLVAGQRDSSVYIAKINNPISSIDNDGESSEFISAYPNPASGFTNISYWLNNPGSINISLHDILGRKVKTITDGYKSEGSHSEYVGLTELPVGIYYIVLKAGSERKTVKFSVSK